MRTFLRGKVTLIFTSLGLLLAFAGIALADNFQNTLASSAGGTVTITTDGVTAGTTAPIGYRVVGTGGDGGPTGSGGNCNATSSNPLSVSFSVNNVTASPSSLSFTSCGTTQNVTFSSKTPGTYTIDPGLSYSATGGTYTDQSPFTLVVNDKCPSGDLSGDLQDGKCDAPVTNTKPTLTLPNNQTVEATSAAGAVVNYTASATDAEDDPDPTPNCTPASGSTFALGTTTVNCSVTDSGSLSDSGSFTVTVTDNTPPTLNLPNNQTAEATGPNGAAVIFSAPTASDIVDGSVTPNCDADSAVTRSP